MEIHDGGGLDDVVGGEGVSASSAVIDSLESTRLVEGLVSFNLADVGGPAWMKQHEVLEKLNLQAHHCVLSQSDNFVMEDLVTYEKVALLVRELLVVEAWRERIFPGVIKTLRALLTDPATARDAHGATLRLYFILYHEATLANLLEVVLYHDYAMAAADEMILELVDYGARCVARLGAAAADGETPHIDPHVSDDGCRKSTKEVLADLESTDEDPVDAIERQQKEILFSVSVATMTFVRLLAEHVESLPLGVATRMLNTHDLLVALVPLLEFPPWTRRSAAGTWFKFVDQKWREVAAADLLKLTQTEAQVWITLFHLMCAPKFRAQYHFNTFRKEQVLRCRRYLNDVLIDQLPILESVQRYMDELSLMQPPPPERSPLVLEQLPRVREALMSKSNDWSALIRSSVQSLSSSDFADLNRITDIYTDENVSSLLAGGTPPGTSGSDQDADGGAAALEALAAAETTPASALLASATPARCSVRLHSSGAVRAGAPGAEQAARFTVGRSTSVQETSRGAFTRYILVAEDRSGEGSDAATEGATPFDAAASVDVDWSDGRRDSFSLDSVALPAQPAPRRSPFIDNAALCVDDELPEFVWRSVGSLALGLVVQLQFRRLETTRVQCSHVGAASADGGDDESSATTAIVGGGSALVDVRARRRVSFRPRRLDAIVCTDYRSRMRRSKCNGNLPKLDAEDGAQDAQGTRRLARNSTPRREREH